MECLCLFIHQPTWSKNLFHILTWLILYYLILWKKMQCNALNIKTVAKQVWFYFICGTMWLGYMGNPYFIYQATQKILAKVSYPKIISKSKFSNTKKNPLIIPVTWNLEYPHWVGYRTSGEKTTLMCYTDVNSSMLEQRENQSILLVLVKVTLTNFSFQ